MAAAKKKGIRFWALKIFFITLIISSAFSVVSEVFLAELSAAPAVLVLLLIIAIGVLFDIVGVAFASCAQTPFISMASRKVDSAQSSLRLLKNADVVSNICNDVIGDICGIVSGAAGAAIAVNFSFLSGDECSMWGGIAISAIIAAVTVSGKAAGKTIAMKNNVKIVATMGKIAAVFSRKK